MRTTKVGTRDVEHGSRRAVSPFVATCLYVFAGIYLNTSVGAGSAGPSPARIHRIARQTATLSRSLTPAVRRPQLKPLKTQALSADSSGRRGMSAHVKRIQFLLTCRFFFEGLQVGLD